MNPTYALILALVSAAVIAGVGSQFRPTWPWYACAAIILAGCAYAYLKPEHWFANWMQG